MVNFNSVNPHKDRFVQHICNICGGDIKWNFM
jgi:hypothetical protein